MVSEILASFHPLLKLPFDKYTLLALKSQLKLTVRSGHGNLLSINSLKRRGLLSTWMPNVFEAA